MVQLIILALLFAGAVFYLSRNLYLSFQAKKSCASGCGKCGVALNAEKIAKDLRKKETFV